MRKMTEKRNMKKCPVCKCTLKPENYAKHMQKVHGKTVSEDEIATTEEYKLKTKMEKKEWKRAELRRTQLEERKKRIKIMAVVSVVATGILISAIIAWYLYFGMNGQTGNTEIPPQNLIAPDFTLQDASGTMISLHDFKGKVVVLHFMQVLSDCHGTYFYKSDDRAEYDPSLSGYVSLVEIGTVYQFEELKNISNKYSSSNVVIISIIVPPGCCGDPLKFSQDFKNNYDLSWRVASDTMQYDTWYKYIDYLPSDSNHVFTRDPTILVVDKEQHIVYDSGYIDASTLSSKIDALLWG